MLFSTLNEIPVTSWALASLAVFLMGLSKAGLKGLSVFNVTLMALAFGSRASTGLVLPLLILGDIFAVIHYNRHTQWKYILKLLPWMLVGILLGVLLGKDLPEREFNWAMVATILFSLLLLIGWDRRKSESVPSHWAFAGSVGILAGLCTMIGNLAGALTNIFFLAMRLPKNEFVGTLSWLFLITNLFKLPFHLFVWKTVSPESLAIDLWLVPILFLGLFLGLFLVKKFNERNFRRFILIMTAIGAVAILLR